MAVEKQFAFEDSTDRQEGSANIHFWRIRLTSNEERPQ